MEYHQLIAWGRNWGELRPGEGTNWSVWLTQSEGVLAPFNLEQVLLILAPRQRCLLEEEITRTRKQSSSDTPGLQDRQNCQPHHRTFLALLKLIRRDQKGLFILIKEQVNQGDITILNIHKQYSAQYHQKIYCCV